MILKILFSSHLLAITVLSITSLPISLSKPFPLQFLSIGQPQGASALIPFLRKFGYLQNNGSTNTNTEVHSFDHEMLYTQEGIAEAVKIMQKFGALPQTGRLDNETLALLAKPRCGVPDIAHKTSRSKRYLIGSEGWNKRRISYRVENWAPQLGEEAVLSDLRKAFSIWSKYSRLHFVNKPRLSNGEVDISIFFGSDHHGDDYRFDGFGGVLAHAFFPNSNGPLAGDIHFDLDENWYSKSSRRYYGDTSGYNVSFLMVAIHEAGHSLGLSHSPSRDSVMFPYYNGFGEENNDNVRLGYDDIMALYKLYIEREIEDFGNEDDEHTESTTEQHHITDNPSTVSTPTTKFDPEPTASSPNERFPATTQPSLGNENNDEKIPNICANGFDTITFLRNEIFVFKDKYMWRFKDKGMQEPYYPVETSRLFPMLANVTRIDAAFENNEGQLLFFSGKHYWMYDNGENVGPFPITNFDLPTHLEKVDAAFVWGKNKKLYIFSDNLFWRYDMSMERVDDDYPKSIERWRGLPLTGIKSALKWSDEATYFFKSDKFWRFDDTRIQTENGFPLNTFSYWFGC